MARPTHDQIMREIGQDVAVLKEQLVPQLSNSIA